jgi:hypothetical protein
VEERPQLSQISSILAKESTLFLIGEDMHSATTSRASLGEHAMNGANSSTLKTLVAIAIYPRREA